MPPTNPRKNNITGWFPRFNPSGLHLTWERPNYYQAQFITESEEVGHNGVNFVRNGMVTELPAGNEIAAGGDNWAIFRSDPIRLITKHSVILGAGCPAINPDGKLAYVDDRQAEVKNLIFDGKVISRGGITDIRVSRTLVVWSQDGRTWGYKIDNSEPARDLHAAPVEFRPIPIDTPDGPWVLNHTHTGIVVKPYRKKHGYRFDNNGQTFYPDAVFKHGKIVAIFTNDRGEQFEYEFDLGRDFIALDIPLPKPDNPIPPKDIPEQPGPKEPKPIMPQAPDLLDYIQKTIASNLQINTMSDGPFAPNRGGITQLVAGKLGFPWGRKSRDRSMTNLSDDALCYRIEGNRFEIYDILNGTDGSATFSYAGTFHDGENGFFVTIGAAPDKPADKPKDEEKESKPAACVILEGKVKLLEAQVDELLKTVAKLEKAPKPKYKLTGGVVKSSFRLFNTLHGHDHDFKIEEVKE